MAEQTNNVDWRLRDLERRMGAIEEMPRQLTEFQYELRELKQDVAEILKREEARHTQEARAREQAVVDRKADRRWQLTVMAAWASAIIAAIAIIVPLLVGS